MKLPPAQSVDQLFLEQIAIQLELVNVNLQSLIELSTQHDMPELDGGVIEIREPGNVGPKTESEVDIPVEPVQAPKKRGRPKKKV